MMCLYATGRKAKTIKKVGRGEEIESERRLAIVIGTGKGTEWGRRSNQGDEKMREAVSTGSNGSPSRKGGDSRHYRLSCWIVFSDRNGMFGA